MVVRPLVLREYRQGAHVVPATVAEWIPPTQGVVLACGDRVGNPQLRPGTRVLYGLGVGSEVLLEDSTKVRLIREGDVICELE